MIQNRYYLSEMSVSKKHGGGLTLQRILQDDLKQFDSFFHLSSFATDECTIIDELKEREVNLHQLQPDAGIWPRSVCYYRDRVITKLKLHRYFESTSDKRIRKVAEYILQNFELTNSLWLAVPQNIPSVLVMNRLFRSRSVDYVTWLMDDHVIKWNSGWHYPDGFEEEFAFHLQNARKVLVISPTMAQLYRDRFGIDSKVLFGPADPIAPPLYESPEPFGPVRLCYFGAIFGWQKGTLERLASQLPLLGATLDVFALREPPESLRTDCVRVRPPVPPQEVMHRLREYDAVVIAVSFEQASRGLTELNIATKMSECLASGTVTVIIGPEYSAMVKFVREYGGALVITDIENPTQLAELKSIKTNGFRERLLSQARNTAETLCSVETMRNTWQTCWNHQKK